MKTESKICTEDVLKVAQSLKQEMFIEEIQEVIELYSSAEKEDPTANWSEIVEQLIYNIKNK